ncbi:hypothetical protein FE257_004600 [Aspergillus nanangensis]|uniref:Uncharacterized protein n=1 Tax=Aspergillus nanangensis TaxID=2582783 RepID=A0AAD4CYB9_ASPNN|nr:hypothetical protein FE257_004600 [Aspergillus nanangensis]
MAPPPSNLSLVERLKALAQTLQFAWFVGHVTLLISVFRYLLSYVTFNYYSSTAQASYRLAFLSAAVTYGIVVYKGHIARGRLQGSIPNIAVKLAGDENVQYLCMALVWLYSRQIPLALLPFSVYSVFHVATYSRAHLIPTFQPAAAAPASPSSPKPAARQSPLGDTIGRFVKQYYDASMDLVAGLEMALLFRLTLSILTFSKGSIVLMLIYLAFFRARYTQSTFVQSSVRHFVARVDASVSHQSTPPVVRQGWETFKGFVRQGYEATDISRFTAAAAAKEPLLEGLQEHVHLDGQDRGTLTAVGREPAPPRRRRWWPTSTGKTPWTQSLVPPASAPNAVPTRLKSPLMPAAVPAAAPIPTKRDKLGPLGESQGSGNEEYLVPTTVRNRRKRLFVEDSDDEALILRPVEGTVSHFHPHNTGANTIESTTLMGCPKGARVISPEERSVDLQRNRKRILYGEYLVLFSLDRFCRWADLNFN